MDLIKSYKYEDVESNEIRYDDYIISQALDIIARKTEWPRETVAERLISHYGGTIQIAIIDYFRNRGE